MGSALGAAPGSRRPARPGHRHGRRAEERRISRGPVPGGPAGRVALARLGGSSPEARPEGQSRRVYPRADGDDLRTTPGAAGRDGTVPGAVHGRAGRHGRGHRPAVHACQPARVAGVQHAGGHRLRDVLRRAADAGCAARRPVRPPPDDPGQPGRLRGGFGHCRRSHFGGHPDRGAVPARRRRRGLGAVRSAAADDHHPGGADPAAGDRRLERGGRGRRGQRFRRRRRRHRPDQLARRLLGLPPARRCPGRGHRAVPRKGHRRPAQAVAEPGGIGGLHRIGHDVRNRLHGHHPAGRAPGRRPHPGRLRIAGGGLRGHRPAGRGAAAASPAARQPQTARRCRRKLPEHGHHQFRGDPGHPVPAEHAAPQSASGRSRPDPVQPGGHRRGQPVRRGTAPPAGAAGGGRGPGHDRIGRQRADLVSREHLGRAAMRGRRRSRHRAVVGGRHRPGY